MCGFPRVWPALPSFPSVKKLTRFTTVILRSIHEFKPSYTKLNLVGVEILSGKVLPC